jgi:hypothetical protein
LRIAACTLLVVLSTLHIAPARADWEVSFYVDGEMIAYLLLEEPFVGPIKLAGRSGPSGDDEHSGLYDNVYLGYILGSHGWPEVEEGFDALHTSFWGLYGGPTPRLLEGFGNPSPCLMTCGDSTYASGVYSLDPISPDVDWWELLADVRLSSTADFHTIEMGIGAELAPSGPPGQQTLEHVVGMTWTRSWDGQSVIRCVTDCQSAEVPAGDWAGDWHRFAICGRGFFTPVEASSWSRIKAVFR